MEKTNSFPTYVHQESNRYFAMQEEFEDNKRVIRIRISKKNRQYNGQKKKYKKKNNDLQNIRIKLRSSNTNLTKKWTQVLRKGRQFLLH